MLPVIVALLASCTPRILGQSAASIPPVQDPSLAATSKVPSPKQPAATATPPPTVATDEADADLANPSGPPKVGAKAYDFSLQTLDGQTLKLSDLRGKKVMLNFWASWCGPCRAEIPHMVDIYDEYHTDGLEIVAVNLMEPPEKVQQAVDYFSMPFTILLDDKGLVGKAYYVRGIPTSIFINEDGVIEAVHIGTLTENALRTYIADLMKASST